MEKLSNQEILTLCKKYNITVGPVTDSTRFLYENRLKMIFSVVSLKKELNSDLNAACDSEINTNKKRKLDE
jgi:hypothetical protein